MQALFLSGWCLIGILTWSAPRAHAVPPEFKARNNVDFKSKFPDRPIEKWLGERFLFLELPPEQRAKGYPFYWRIVFVEGRETAPDSITLHEKLVGKTARVTYVGEDATKLVLTLEQEGHQYRTTAFNKSIHYVASCRDIDVARSLFVGKTLSYTGGPVKTVRSRGRKELTLPQYCLVKVTNIKPGDQDYSPIRIHLETASGLKCFIDLRLSETNIPDHLRDEQKPEIPFLTYDPRKVYKWPADIWKAIEDRRVIVGMKSLQVRAAIGEPDDEVATSTGIAWSYTLPEARKVITFVKGAVASVQTLPSVKNRNTPSR